MPCKSNVIHGNNEIWLFSSPTSFRECISNKCVLNNNKFETIARPLHLTFAWHTHHIALQMIHSQVPLHTHNILNSHMNKTMTYTFHPFHFIYLCILLSPRTPWMGFFPTDSATNSEHSLLTWQQKVEFIAYAWIDIIKIIIATRQSVLRLIYIPWRGWKLLTSFRRRSQLRHVLLSVTQ